MSEAAKQERSIVRKLAEVTKLVDRIAKNGRNQAQNYDFVTEADILDAVRLHMAERNLVPFPHVREQQWETLTTKSGGIKKLCTFTVEFRIEDGDSGEIRTWDVISQGEDTGDKAAYKAITGAEKYGLLKVFMIPTGDDPEKDSEHRYIPGKQAAANDAPVPAKTAPGKSHPGGSMVIKYGEGKGKTISALTDAELQWQMEMTDKAVAAKDPKWHKANLAKQAALQAEAQLRISATPSGHIKAPNTTSPRQAELPVNEDDGGEIVTPTAAFIRMAREYKMPLADLMKRAKGALNGKETNFTHGDVAIVRSSLEAVPHR